MSDIVRTSSEWEVWLGEQVREARLLQGVTQRDLAGRAGVSVSALGKLENGTGSELRTLVRVVRALDRTDWLSALAPPVRVSPMQMLRDERRARPRRRAFTPRRPRAASDES